jgi:hypothetical protein
VADQIKLAMKTVEIAMLNGSTEERLVPQVGAQNPKSTMGNESPKKPCPQHHPEQLGWRVELVFINHEINIPLII